MEKGWPPEKEMRTIMETARSAIHARDLNERLWTETAKYAINQTEKSSDNGNSPIDVCFDLFY